MKPKTISSQIIALPCLSIHEDNVRKHPSNPTDEYIGELASSIKSVGLINPLTVIPFKGNKYGVIAGGRRLMALQRLSETSDLPEAYADGVPCQVIDDTDSSSLEISLTENVQRQVMSAADQIDAWGKLVSEGFDTEQIAARFGVDEKLVLQRIALSKVIPEILQMLRDEQITLSTVKAFTLSDDPEKQRAALQHCDGHINEWKVRRFFSANSVSINDKRVRFVGLDAYLKAGGRITRDLFDDEETLLHDEDILQSLCQQALEAARAEWLNKGWSWVKLETDEGFSDFQYNLYSKYRRDYGNEPEATHEEQNRIDEINDLLMNDDSAYDHDALEDELARLEATIESRRTWDKDVMQKAGVRIYLSLTGELDIDAGWVKKETQKARTDSNVETEAAPSTYNGSHQVDLGHVRTRIVHLAMLQDSELVNDVLAFQLALETSSLQEHVGHQRFGSIGIQAFYTKLHDNQAPLHDALMKQLDKLNKSWLKAKDTYERFNLFRKLKPEQKQAWVNWAVAVSIDVTLDSSVGDTNSRPFDSVIPELDIDWVTAWRPDEAYFSRLSKTNILEMMRPVLGDEWVDQHKATHKKSTLVQIVADIVGGKAKSLTAEQQAAVAEWSPPGFAPVSQSTAKTVEKLSDATGDDDLPENLQDEA